MPARCSRCSALPANVTFTKRSWTLCAATTASDRCASAMRHTCSGNTMSMARWCCALRRFSPTLASPGRIPRWRPCSGGWSKAPSRPTTWSIPDSGSTARNRATTRSLKRCAGWPRTGARNSRRFSASTPVPRVGRRGPTRSAPNCSNAPTTKNWGSLRRRSKGSTRMRLTCCYRRSDCSIPRIRDSGRRYVPTNANLRQMG